MEAQQREIPPPWPDDFRQDDKWQREMRDRFLVPYYRRRYANFILLDDGPLAKRQQKRGMDTIVNNAGIIEAIEEKIVRWKGRVYEAICIETDSCTNERMLTHGWVHYAEADHLLYCMQSGLGDLDCLKINFRQLQKWFLPIENHFRPHTMPGTINHSLSRLVPIDVLCRNVQVERFRLEESKKE